MRAPQLTILLGFNGTGKTTLLNQILVESQRKCLVITPDDIEWRQYPLNELQSSEDFNFSGIQRHIWNPDYTLERLKYYNRGILVFDDCRSYFQDRTSPEVRELLIRRRQRMVDVFAVGHGFTQVPPVFFTFCNTFILFRTVDNIVKRKDCLINFEEMATAQNDVNRKAKSDPHYYKIISVK